MNLQPDRPEYFYLAKLVEDMLSQVYNVYSTNMSDLKVNSIILKKAF